jgi:hypothetical protein
MPFEGWLDDYYTSIYCPAIDAAGLEPHRADDLYRPSTIVNDIWAYTRRARLLLADLTGKNPNVFYELGLAHALAKPAILVAESMDDIPFDLRPLRIIVYDKNDPRWGDLLRHNVQTAIEEVIRAPQEAVLPAFLHIRDSPGAVSVTAREKELIQIRQDLDSLRQEVRLGFLRGSRERDLMRPMAARQQIAEYAGAGVPLSIIIDRLTRRGVPESFVRDEFERYVRSRLPVAAVPDKVAADSATESPKTATTTIVSATGTVS